MVKLNFLLKKGLNQEFKEKFIIMVYKREKIQRSGGIIILLLKLKCQKFSIWNKKNYLKNFKLVKNNIEI